MTLDEDGGKLFADMVDALQHKDIVVLSKWASQIAKGNYTEAFLDNLIAHYSTCQQYHFIPPCITTLRMVASNVSAEHSLFSLFLELMK
jgi:hypothetical protein